MIFSFNVFRKNVIIKVNQIQAVIFLDSFTIWKHLELHTNSAIKHFWTIIFWHAQILTKLTETVSFVSAL